MFQGKPENGRLNKVVINFQLQFLTKFVLAEKVFCKHLQLVISQLLDKIFQPFKEQKRYQSLGTPILIFLGILLKTLYSESLKEDCCILTDSVSLVSSLSQVSTETVAL